MTASVDDGSFLRFTLPLITFIGFYADIALTAWLALHSPLYSVEMAVCMVCLVVSYLSNIASMVTVLLKILQSEMTSISTKRYFQEFSQFYIAMAAASGDCFMPFWLISSNLFGAPLLNSGLSRGQREQYRMHHFCGVILLRNIPFLGIELVVGFDSNSIVVVAAMLFTICSIGICIVSMLDFYVIHKRQIEAPFTINLQWESKGDIDGDGGRNRDDEDIADAMRSITARRRGSVRTDYPSTNPLSRMGRRRRLAVELEVRVGANFESHGQRRFGVEVLSTTPQRSGVWIHAVICGMGPDSDRLVQETVDGLEREKTLRLMVHNAVMAAFKLEEFSEHYIFTVTAWKHCYRPPPSHKTPQIEHHHKPTDHEVAGISKTQHFFKGISSLGLKPTESDIVTVLEHQRQTGEHETRMSTAL